MAHIPEQSLIGGAEVLGGGLSLLEMLKFLFDGHYLGAIGFGLLSAVLLKDGTSRVKQSLSSGTRS